VEGGGEEMRCLWGAGSRAVGVQQALLTLLLIHLCSAQAGVSVQEGCSSLLRFFFRLLFSFFFVLKGIVRRMLSSWQLARGARGESSLLLVVLQRATVKTRQRLWGILSFLSLWKLFFFVSR